MPDPGTQGQVTHPGSGPAHHCVNHTELTWAPAAWAWGAQGRVLLSACFLASPSPALRTQLPPGVLPELVGSLGLPSPKVLAAFAI